jgi:hypothetical protein
MPDCSAAAGRQWTGARQRGERGVASAPSGVGERHDGLSCGDRADAAALGQPGSHLVDDGLQLGPVGPQRVTPCPHGKSQASDLAVPHRLFAAGLAWLPAPRHGQEHRIGERRPSQVTLAILPAQQKRTEPVGLRGGCHAELVTSGEQNPQRLTVTVSTR